MNNNNLSELEYESEDVKIKISNKVANNTPNTSAVIIRTRRTNNSKYS